MANVTKAISGNVTTYTITDSSGVTGTIACNVAPVTGPLYTIATTNMHRDGIQMMCTLMEQLQTNLLPGAGAQNLTN